METGLTNILNEFLTSHPRFQEKNLLKMRIEVSREILQLDLSEDRRSYLLHQLSHAHSVEEVSELVAQVIG